MIVTARCAVVGSVAAAGLATYALMTDNVIVYGINCYLLGVLSIVASFNYKMARGI